MENNMIPQVVREAVDAGFDVVLNKSGYFIGGFYGNNPKTSLMVQTDDYVGYVLVTQNNGLVEGYDYKGKRHALTDFDALVNLNHHIWKNFVKDDKYKKVDKKWFPFLYEKGLLEINPKK